jgi:FlaA1/EpsC-like NDP-sugar epimerase
MNFIDIPSFINTHITKRDVSMFQSDIDNFKTQLTSEIASKSVLVIGGAGTIGSSFIKALLKFKPAKLIVVDTNENGLTELTRDLRSEQGQYIPNTFLTYPMNFGDSVFEKMFLKHAPFDIVANFAAHKHVRSEKDQFSIEAMITNNVFKANSFLDLLLKHKPKHFFCVSTDKAANPVNVMGASKKLMEELILSYTDQIKITTARFANVAFSNGSLLAGYIDRIFKKQPISCPEDVKRFFVSPEESGQICLLACVLGTSGDIFFPKLESHTMINFKDITLNFFKTMGVKVIQCNSDEEARQGMETCLKDKTYPVYFFKSDTSGEKLYEEFYTKEDTLELDRFKSLGVIENTSKPSKKNILECIASLKTLMDTPNYSKASIIAVMKEFISDFDHIETGKNLDQKM